MLALSTIAALSSITVNPFSARTLLALSTIAAQSALTGQVSTTAFLILSPTGAVLIVTVNPFSSPTKLALSTIVATSSITIIGIDSAIPSRGIRVDIYDSAEATKQGTGPILTVSQVDYLQELNRIGSAQVIMSADDAAAAYLSAREVLWIYKVDEGLVYRGKVVNIGTSVDPSVNNIVIDLVSPEEDFIGYNTGAGILGSAPGASLASWFSQLLHNNQIIIDTIWTPVYGSPPNVYAGSIIGKTLWQAFDELRGVFGYNLLADTVTLSGVTPVKKIYIDALGSDSGLTFGQVSQMTPELQANTQYIPIQKISQQRNSRDIWNSVIAVGPGNGYPTLTLKNASHGANLCANPNFEVDTSGWTPTAGTFAISAVQHKNGAWSGLLTRTSGAQFYTAYAATISGVTTARTWKLGIWVYGSGSAVGKTGLVQISLNGGSSPTSGVLSPTIVAGWQYWTCPVAALDANSTSVTMYIGVASGAVAGDILYIDRATLWENTNYPYCVEWEYSPSSIVQYFIEDPVSVAANGRRQRYLAFPGTTPTAATKTAYIAAVDGVYDAARRFLDLNKNEVTTVDVQVAEMKHVSNGVQLVKPGLKSRVVYHGWTQQVEDPSKRTWLSIDQSLWHISQKRTLRADGSAPWQLKFSSVDWVVLDANEKFAKFYSDVTNDPMQAKQSNYHITLQGLGSYVYPGNGFYQVIVVPTADILAVQSAKLTVGQSQGGAVTTAVFVERFNGDVGAAIAISTFNPAARTVVDLTSYFQQTPTPVPWPPYASGVANHPMGPYVHIQQQTGGATNLQLDITLEIEVTKVTLAPT